MSIFPEYTTNSSKLNSPVENYNRIINDRVLNNIITQIDDELVELKNLVASFTSPAQKLHAASQLNDVLTAIRLRKEFTASYLHEPIQEPW